MFVFPTWLILVRVTLDIRWQIVFGKFSMKGSFCFYFTSTLIGAVALLNDDNWLEWCNAVRSYIIKESIDLNAILFLILII